jgi:ABC-2 type transport system permease protein
MFSSIKHHFKVWVRATLSELQMYFIYPLSTILFLIAKILRFFTFFLFLYLLTDKTKTLAGYTQNQIIFFYLTFNLIDIAEQIFLRGVYWFRGALISGNFDLRLTKPVNPLFSVLFSHTDFIDVSTLILLVFFIINFIQKSAFIISPQNILLYLLLILNGFIIGLSLHIIVSSLGVITLEVDQLIWIYRDLATMARYPIDVYHLHLQRILTFIIPIGLIFTIPAKAFFSLLTPKWIAFSFAFGIIFLLLSLKLWQVCLKRYSSASS